MQRTKSLGLLFCLTTLAQAQEGTYDGRTSAEWSRLLEAGKNGRESLAAGGAKALPVVRILLADKNEGTVQHAARVCEAMGPTASPAIPDLLRGLRTANRWWTRLYCAQALGSIGRSEPAILDALFDGLQSPAAAHLRQTCARALWLLSSVTSLGSLHSILSPAVVLKLLADPDHGPYSQQDQERGAHG